MGEQISVPTRIRGRFRAASDPGPPRSGWGFQAPGSSLRDLPPSLRPPEALLEFLLEMDRKLDAILGCLQRETLRETFPDEGWVTALGRDRLTLETASSLGEGDCLELALLLEEFPLRLVVVAARVEGPAREEAAAFCLAYACGREEDREILIRRIFQEERRLLRLRKDVPPA
ncbi:MAG: hypothetical protein LBP61_00240 [Desulfovibrio sp.]|jgi:hypothetical protein|nr:hypothetical protein [Desulfovibrio sp.]